ncbi:MAG: EamA family transporter [Thermoanaerobaculia bacterium]|nr:EamA family transporter [Thermoanaerobaculia bacterium]
MLYLLCVSLVWAFSFGLIGSRLAGLDPSFVAMSRLAIALVCFVPMLRLGGTSWKDRGELMALGALQFGLMYVAYIQAFAHLPSHLVALFTITTPIYVIVANDLMERRFHRGFLLCALLSVAGASVIRFSVPTDDFWWGFGLVQLANLAFGTGQVWYRRFRQRRRNLLDRQIFAWPYLGGVLFAGLAFLISSGGGLPDVRTDQWWVLLYLGIVASGLGFFLWNKGATLVSPGVLAAFNNAVVPLAVLASLLVFGEAKGVAPAQAVRLVAGAAMIGTAILVGRTESRFMEPGVD